MQRHRSTIFTITLSALALAVLPVFGVDGLDDNFHPLGLLESNDEFLDQFPDSVPVEGGVPVLNSRPGAPNTLYIDFDGEVLSGTTWNSRYGKEVIHFPAFGLSSDDDPTIFTKEELAAIVGVWQEVAERFRPFNVNVTTVRPDGNLYGGRKDVAVAICTKNYDLNDPTRVPLEWLTSGGGMSLFGGLGIAPALDFGEGNTVAHEVGHLFGLHHDGQYRDDGSLQEYGGRDSIMAMAGVNWSRGDYYRANNTQDDIGMIASRWGYAPDDHGNLIGDATPLPDPSATAYLLEGDINYAFDADVFIFTATSPFTEIRVRGYSKVPFDAGNIMCEPAIDLLDSEGNVVASSNEKHRLVMEAMRIHTVPGHNYLVRVRGDRIGDYPNFDNDPNATSAYGSVGTYLLLMKAHDYYLPLIHTPRIGDPLRLEVRTRAGSHSFQWSKDGEPINGATSSLYKINSFERKDAGLYSVTYTDGTAAKVVSAQTVVKPSLFNTVAVYFQGSNVQPFPEGFVNPNGLDIVDASGWSHGRYVTTDGRLITEFGREFDPWEYHYGAAYPFLAINIIDSGDLAGTYRYDMIASSERFNTNPLEGEGIGTLPEWRSVEDALDDPYYAALDAPNYPPEGYVQVTDMYYGSYYGLTNGGDVVFHEISDRTTGQGTEITYHDPVPVISNAIRIFDTSDKMLAFVESDGLPGAEPKPTADNNAFSARRVLVPGMNKGSNLGATRQDNEPLHAGGNRSVWWEWTPDESGEYVVSTRASTFNTTLAVYTGETLGSLVEVASNDDAHGGGLQTSEVRVRAVAGMSYKVAVGGYSGDEGEIRLRAYKDDIPDYLALSPEQDSGPPEITVVSPLEGVPISVGEEGLTVTGMTSDQVEVISLSGGSEITVKRDDGSLNRFTAPLNITLNEDGSWVAWLPMQGPGTYTLNINAYDYFLKLQAVSFTFDVTDKVRVTLVKADPEHGKLTTNGFKGEGELLLIPGKTYKLTAKPAKGMIFKEWLLDGVSVSTSRTFEFEFEDGMTIEPTFELSPFEPVAGNYYGVIGTGQGTSTTYATLNGAIRIRPRPDGSFSGYVLFEGRKRRFVGEFDSTGASTVYLSGGNAMDLFFDTSVDPPLISGTINGVALEARKALALDPATYTMVLKPENYNLSGYGYARLVLGKKSRKFAGRLPDGRRISGGTAAISSDTAGMADIVIFKGYGKRSASALLAGILQIPRAIAPDNDLTGEIGFFVGKNPKARMYPGGLAEPLEAIGSIWEVPSENLLTGNANTRTFSLRLDPGGIMLEGPAQVSGTWNKDNTTTLQDPEGSTRFKASTKSGYFSGRTDAIDDFSGDTERLTFKGIMLCRPFSDGSRKVHGAGCLQIKNTPYSAAVEVTTAN